MCLPIAHGRLAVRTLGPPPPAKPSLPTWLPNHTPVLTCFCPCLTCPDRSCSQRPQTLLSQARDSSADDCQWDEVRLPSGFQHAVGFDEQGTEKLRFSLGGGTRSHFRSDQSMQSRTGLAVCNPQSMQPSPRTAFCRDRTGLTGFDL